MYRTHTCGELTAKNISDTIVLCGWIKRRRDHGGLIFIDLRDQYGITQVVFDPERDKNSFELAKSLRNEFVIRIEGLVEQRPDDAENEGLTTGEIEVSANKLEILNKSNTTPFEIDDDVKVGEEIKLKYRYLDLRRNKLHSDIQTRSAVTYLVREFLHEKGFCEIETPILMKSTPEGARDFLVPSRISPGKFYALPQSPQTYKQLLMVSGFDKYFQIVKCFRDEDLRKDRQLEFTQIDMEMSFVNENDIIDIASDLTRAIFKNIGNIEIELPIPRLSYHKAMTAYGSDKPDLRFDLKIQTISDIFTETEFNAFKNDAADAQIACINVKNGQTITRKQVDNLIEDAKKFGAKGLAWFRFTDGEIVNGVAKFLTEKEKKELKEQLNLSDGDLCLIISDVFQVTYEVLGQIRLILADMLTLVDKSKLNLVWIVDFPLLEYSVEDNRFVARHHPFTSPVADDLELLEKAPEKVKARAYDLVLNGNEIAGGSIRIHDSETQEKMFAALGIEKQEADEKFGFLINALKYGAPPHGGIAFGLDRLVMILTGNESIRDVIAFPKTSSGMSLMDDCPSEVVDNQLKELHLKTINY